MGVGMMEGDMDDEDERYEEDEGNYARPQSAAGGRRSGGRGVHAMGRPGSAMSTSSHGSRPRSGLRRPASATGGARTFARTGLGSLAAQRAGAMQIGGGGGDAGS